MAIGIDREKCISCESCVATCPVGAVEMEDNKARIKEEECISCGTCINECPVEAIAAVSPEKAAEKPDNAAGHDVWVAVEFENGEPAKVAYELLSAAAKLAAKAGEKCCAILFAPEKGDVPQKLIAAGADKVYCITGQQYADYNTDLYVTAFCRLVNEYKPKVVLFGSTADGRDFAPRVAARLRTGLCADCTEIDIDPDTDIVKWTRPALGGNILATIVCENHRPQMGTVHPKVFKALEEDSSRTGEIIDFACESVESRVKLLKKENLTAGGDIKIEDASVICSGGRGMGCPDNFKLLEELAALFENASVAGSRAIVDEGWIPHSKQVGQSGKTVTPKIYFACGISGAIQHLAGMNASDIIIAINKDASAPIFKVAQYGIVGNACEILPKLIDKIKNYKQS